MPLLCAEPACWLWWNPNSTTAPAAQLQRWLSVGAASHSFSLQANTVIVTGNSQKEPGISQTHSPRTPRMSSQPLKCHMLLHRHLCFSMDLLKAMCYFSGYFSGVIFLVSPSPEGKQCLSVVPDRMAGASLLVFPTMSHCGKGYLLFARATVRLEQQSMGFCVNSQVSLLPMTLEILTVSFWELMKASSPPNHYESFVLYIQKSLVLLT